MKEATLILPHHLFEHHPAVTQDRHIFLVEEPYFFTRFAFHKQKLILHRASLQAYYEQFDRRIYTVTYIDFTTDYWQTIEDTNIDIVYMVDPLDHALDEKLKHKAYERGIQLSIMQTPAFIDAPGAIYTLQKQSSFFMASFYKKQRQRFDILMENGDPVGDAYSYDTENRKPLPDDYEVPELWTPPNTHIRNARAYINEHFPDNPGTDAPFLYPVTHEDAKKWLHDFVSNRLIHFGDYQDAIHTDEPFLFHSVLSPLLNTGLLTPKLVTDTVIKAYKEYNIPINNVEGFIRQVIGWREYMYAAYVLKGKEEKNSNFFEHTTSLPKEVWNGTTGVDPVDTVIKRVLHHAYAHHIERLMVLSNYMLLCCFDPNEIYQWFMQLFIDAYDWVMVPNVYGMGQFADGGVISTKPYVSSSSYIKKMSNFPSGEWCNTWDSLYWNFIDTHAQKLNDLGRMGLVMHHYKNMDTKTLDKHRKRAHEHIDSLTYTKE